MKTICLNMIVKNESKIITRLLLSVLPIIDTFCICDTGSTDNTKKLIVDFFNARGIKGKIVEKEFIDFGINRTFALHSAIGMADYALLLDADMILEIGPNFDKTSLNKDVYSIRQGSDTFQLANTRLLSLKLNVTVKCPTHEYYSINGDYSYQDMGKDFLFINDIGDGGCKADKFERDIRLFKNALLKNPSDPDAGRYYFYIANSYFNISDYKNAILYYKKRIAMGDWIEEVFYSHYQLGHCYNKLDDEKNAIFHWLQGYQVMPTRAESLYEIVKFYRITGKQQLALLFFNIAKNIQYPVNARLFLHKDIYDYLLLYELSVIACWVNITNISSVYMKLFHKMPLNQLDHLFSNYKFYKKVLPNANKTIPFSNSFERTINGIVQKFVASSPSIVPYKSGYLMNLRFVNYTISDKGTYDWNKNIITINKSIYLSSSFITIEEKEMLQETNTNDCKYIGIEDVKLFAVDTKEKQRTVVSNDSSIIYFTGTCFVGDDARVCIGSYTSTNDSIILVNKQACEKNWVFVPTGKNRMIYNWYPLTMGTVVDNDLLLDTSIKMPQLFQKARGSTNGVIFDNEIWFIVHFVDICNNEPRHYYHSFVIFDMNMKLLRYTIPLKFTETAIEYCLGLIVNEKEVILSHSLMDKEAYIRVYNKSVIDELFTREWII